MLSNLKVLGLTVIAVFAVSAAVASMASAQQGELTSDGPFTLTGTDTAKVTPGPNYSSSLTEGPLGAIFTCEDSAYTGHKASSTPHELLENGATEATVTPHYKNCLGHIPLLGTRHVVVDMNGCDYLLTTGETTGEVNGTYGVTAELVCPKEGHIKITLFNGLTTKTICTITVGPQALASEAHLTHNTAGDDITLTGSFNNIKESHEGSLCGTGESEVPDLDLDITIKAHNAEGSNAPVTITEPPPPPQQGKLTSDGPFTLTGTDTAKVTPGPNYSSALTEGPLGAIITCEDSTFTGHAPTWTPHTLLANGATEVTVTPHFVNCLSHIPILGTRHVKVTMNGCDYLFTAGETTGGVEHTYGLTAHIVCPENQKIDMHIYNGATTATICTITFGPQTPTSDAHLTHNTAGDDITLTGSLTNIKENHEGSLCGTGESSNTVLDLDMTIKAHSADGLNTPVTITH